MASHTEEEQLEREYAINDLSITQAIMAKLVSGVGFLALTWSTVVLLGGFVSALQIKEFWYLTTVSLVLASSILATYDNNPDTLVSVSRRILNDEIRRDWGSMGISGWFCMEICTITSVLVLFAIKIVFFMNTYGPLATIVISMMRLIQHDYDGSDAANKEKLRAALFVFYCLALVHGVCSICCFILLGLLIKRLDEVSKRCGFGELGRKVLGEYSKETKLKYANDLTVPAGWNLVAYAVGLLDSISPDDNLSGVRMLDTFVAGKTKRCIRVELLSSRRAIQNLITMLGWTTPSPDVQEMRERAARIVADISGEQLRIARFPGALQCVSSLLEAEQLPQITAARDPNQPSQDAVTIMNHWISQLVNKSLEWAADEQRGCDRWTKLLKAIMRRKKEETTFEPKGTKELILQGLLILERLAYDEHNCREIVNTPGLLSKITTPITSQAFLHAGYGDTWVSILCSSLRVVSRLISASGEAGTRLRHEISASKEAIHNMLEILEGDTDGCKKLQEQAIEILTELALGPTNKTKDFVKTLGRIFLDKSDANRLRRKAGEAIAKLLSTESASGLDHQLPKQDVINLLAEIIGIILSTKIERKADEAARSASGNTAEGQSAGAGTSNYSVIEINKSTEQNDEQSEERKLVAALLSLTVVICDKLIDANDFCSVVPVEGELINKLKHIIVQSNDTTADYLRIVKLTCQVVIAMMKLKPSCIKEFNEHNFDEVLSKALDTLSDLDNCMLFAGNDRELTKPARSLTSLVKEAHQLFNKAQEPASGGPGGDVIGIQITEDRD